MPDKSRRRDDDDDEDDRPRRRRKSRDDDDDDDVPLRGKGKKSGSSLPLILGGGALLVVILGCCGVGSYFAFFRGGSPLGIGNHYTITSASIQPFGGMGTTLNLAYDMHAGVENTEDYYAVVKMNGRKYDAKMTMLFTAPGGNGSQGVLIPGLGGSGPFEVWIEKRSGGSSKVVSNTYRGR